MRGDEKIDSDNKTAALRPSAAPVSEPQEQVILDQMGAYDVGADGFVYVMADQWDEWKYRLRQAAAPVSGESEQLVRELYRRIGLVIQIVERKHAPRSDEEEAMIGTLRLWETLASRLIDLAAAPVSEEIAKLADSWDEVAEHVNEGAADVEAMAYRTCARELRALLSALQQER